MANQSTRGEAPSRPLALGIIVALLVFAVGEWLVYLEQARERQVAHTQLQTKASLVRARLEAELARAFSVGLSAASLVSSKPDFSASDYERLARTLAGWQPGLRNIAIAPDNIVRYVYPRAGNEKVIGANLEEVPAQSAGVQRMRRDWKPTVAGPVPLVQGGFGIIQRVPIIVYDHADQPHYWGLVSVVMDTGPWLERAGLQKDDAVQYALRGRDGSGAKGEAFFGSAALFDDPVAVKMGVTMPGGQWQLAARWRDTGAFSWRYALWHLIALLVALGGGALVCLATRNRDRLQVLASQDSLTGLANRHQFQLQAESFLALAARRNFPFTLLNLDLEGFKAINDDHGHDAGDAMLVHVARQAKECLRASDFIARFGGDEFLVLLPDTGPGAELDLLVERLREAIAQPLELDGKLLRVGISVGMASYPRDGFTIDDLMRVADFSMYANKRSRKREVA